jgi:hypothetical protein
MPPRAATTDKRVKIPLDRVREDGTVVPPNQRTPMQKEIDRTELARLLRRGYSLAEAAKQLGLNAGIVERDWIRMLKDLRNRRANDAQEKVDVILEEYAEIKKEAWDAWDKSKKPFQKVMKEQTTSGKKHLSVDSDGDEIVDKNNPDTMERVQTTVEWQCGDPRFLQVVANCLEAERELQGLNPPKQVGVRAAIISWDDIQQGLDMTGDVQDVIEGKIVEAATRAMVEYTATGEGGKDRAGKPKTDLEVFEELEVSNDEEREEEQAGNESLPVPPRPVRKQGGDQPERENLLHGNTSEKQEDGTRGLRRGQITIVAKNVQGEISPVLENIETVSPGHAKVKVGNGPKVSPKVGKPPARKGKKK